MNVKTKGHTVIVTSNSADIDAIANELIHRPDIGSGKNLVIDLTAIGKIQPKSLSTFGELAKAQKKKKKSLVFVANTDYDKASKFVVVPTVQEAHDMIEMDEIERDLGF